MEGETERRRSRRRRSAADAAEDGSRLEEEIRQVSKQFADAQMRERAGAQDAQPRRRHSAGSGNAARGVRQGGKPEAAAAAAAPGGLQLLDGNVMERGDFVAEFVRTVRGFVVYLAALRFEDAIRAVNPLFALSRPVLTQWDNMTAPLLLLVACDRIFHETTFLHGAHAKQQSLPQLYAQVRGDLRVVRALVLLDESEKRHRLDSIPGAVSPADYDDDEGGEEEEAKEVEEAEEKEEEKEESKAVYYEGVQHQDRRNEGRATFYDDSNEHVGSHCAIGREFSEPNIAGMFQSAITTEEAGGGRSRGRSGGGTGDDAASAHQLQPQNRHDPTIHNALDYSYEHDIEPQSARSASQRPTRGPQSRPGWTSMRDSRASSGQRGLSPQTSTLVHILGQLCSYITCRRLLATLYTHISDSPPRQSHALILLACEELQERVDRPCVATQMQPLWTSLHLEVSCLTQLFRARDAILSANFAGSVVAVRRLQVLLTKWMHHVRVVREQANLQLPHEMGDVPPPTALAARSPARSADAQMISQAIVRDATASPVVEEGARAAAAAGAATAALTGAAGTGPSTVREEREATRTVGTGLHLSDREEKGWRHALGRLWDQLVGDPDGDSSGDVSPTAVPSTKYFPAHTATDATGSVGGAAPSLSEGTNDRGRHHDSSNVVGLMIRSASTGAALHASGQAAARRPVVDEIPLPLPVMLWMRRLSDCFTWKMSLVFERIWDAGDLLFAAPVPTDNMTLFGASSSTSMSGSGPATVSGAESSNDATSTGVLTGVSFSALVEDFLSLFMSAPSVCVAVIAHRPADEAPELEFGYIFPKTADAAAAAAIADGAAEAQTGAHSTAYPSPDDRFFGAGCDRGGAGDRVNAQLQQQLLLLGTNEASSMWGHLDRADGLNSWPPVFLRYSRRVHKLMNATAAMSTTSTTVDRAPPSSLIVPQPYAAHTPAQRFAHLSPGRSGGGAGVGVAAGAVSQGGDAPYVAMASPRISCGPPSALASGGTSSGALRPTVIRAQQPESPAVRGSRFRTRPASLATAGPQGRTDSSTSSLRRAGGSVPVSGDKTSVRSPSGGDRGAGSVGCGSRESDGEQSGAETGKQDDTVPTATPAWMEEWYAPCWHTIVSLLSSLDAAELDEEDVLDVDNADDDGDEDDVGVSVDASVDVGEVDAMDTRDAARSVDDTAALKGTVGGRYAEGEHRHLHQHHRQSEGQQRREELRRKRHAIAARAQQHDDRQATSSTQIPRLQTQSANGGEDARRAAHRDGSNRRRRRLPHAHPHYFLEARRNGGGQPTTYFYSRLSEALYLVVLFTDARKSTDQRVHRFFDKFSRAFWDESSFRALGAETGSKGGGGEGATHTNDPQQRERQRRSRQE